MKIYKQKFSSSASQIIVPASTWAPCTPFHFQTYKAPTSIPATPTISPNKIGPASSPLLRPAALALCVAVVRTLALLLLMDVGVALLEVEEVEETVGEGNVSVG